MLATKRAVHACRAGGLHDPICNPYAVTVSICKWVRDKCCQSIYIHRNIKPFSFATQKKR